MLTEKNYCDNDTYTALCELGISHTYVCCLMDKGKLVIHLYDAQKWLREEKNVHITINYICLEENIFMYTLRYIGKKLREGSGLYNNEQYSSYEEALLEGVKYAVKILKEK